METSRPCTDGFVCLNHECDTAPPADAAPACTVDSDCPSTAPHCTSTNTCVQCIDSTQCSGTSPVCDATTNACRACSADSDCASNVCDVDTGTCTAEAAVLYAAPTGTDSATCTRADPCSLVHAVAIADGTRPTIKLATGSYVANVSIGAKTISIHGEGASIAPSQAGNTITIGVGAHVQLSGAALTGDSSGAVLFCGNSDPNATPVPSLDLRGVNIDSSGFVLIAYPCRVITSNCRFNSRVQSPGIVIFSPSSANLDRCVFEGHGVESLGDGALVRVSNSVFVDQVVESAPSDLGPLSGTHFGTDERAGQAFASFTTFVNTKLLLCGSGLPSCAGGNDPGVCLDNSIITSPSGDAVSGSGCHVSYSIVTPQTAPLAGANNHVNVDPGFSGGSSYTLKSSSPAVDAADPNAVDSIDLAGTARPQGAHDDIGAYEYKP